jgi:hypothetical protein
VAAYLRLKEARALAVTEADRARQAAAEEAKWRRQAEREALLAGLTLHANGADMDQLVTSSMPGMMREQYFQRRVEHWTNALSVAQSALEGYNDDREIRMMALQIMGAHARARFKAGHTAEAREAAIEWLSESTDTNAWYHGNVVHDANVLLGRIALGEGSPAAAGEYLLQAGETPGSPQLNSFGPDLSLARELLESGSSEVVLNYLDRVEEFWGRRYGGEGTDVTDESKNAGRLEKWRKEIVAGRIPEDPKWLNLEAGR